MTKPQRFYMRAPWVTVLLAVMLTLQGIVILRARPQTSQELLVMSSLLALLTLPLWIEIAYCNLLHKGWVTISRETIHFQSSFYSWSLQRSEITHGEVFRQPSQGRHLGLYTKESQAKPLVLAAGHYLFGPYTATIPLSRFSEADAKDIQELLLGSAR